MVVSFASIVDLFCAKIASLRIIVLLLVALIVIDIPLSGLLPVTSERDLGVVVLICTVVVSFVPIVDLVCDKVAVVTLFPVIVIW